MAYCIMRVDKVKNQGTLTSLYKHNYRKEEVSNADSSRAHLNEELIKLADKDGNYSNATTLQETETITYNQAFKKRISELDYYDNHNIRSDAVLAFEILLTYSKDAEGINEEEWKKENIKWLEETFNVAPDGRKNVVSAVYHNDEVTPHIHALIIPIDENGRLNAKRFTGGYQSMMSLQDSYANSMSRFNLQRGTKKSSATHEDVRKYYADLNAAINDIPKPKENELATDYYERTRDDVSTVMASLLKQKKENERNIRRANDENRNKMREESAELKNKTNADLQKAMNELSSLNEEIEKKKKELKQLERESKAYEQKQDEIDDLKFRASMFDDMQTAYEFVESVDPELIKRYNNIATKRTQQETI